MNYLLDTFKAEEFESSEDMLNELQTRVFAQKLTRFVMLVMPSKEYHLEQDKDETEMVNEISRLALDFVKHDGTIDEAYDTELVQKFIAWSHHEMILRENVALSVLKKSFEIIDEKDNQSEESIH